MDKVGRVFSSRPLLDELSALRSSERGDVLFGCSPWSGSFLHRKRVLCDLCRDDQVWACWRQRTESVVASEWSVTPGGDRPEDHAACDFLRLQLSRLRFDDICRKMLWGEFYGFSIAECIWGSEDGRTVLEGLRVRRAERFRLLSDDRLQLLGPGSAKFLPSRKFWVYCASAQSDDDIYGPGLGEQLYWPVFFKRHGVRFWSAGLEKFSVPTVIGRSDLTGGKREKQEILDILDSMTSSSTIVAPRGLEIELLEARRRSGGDHAVFCQYMDRMIAKVLLGQPGTTEIGQHRGNAEVLQSIQFHLVKASADSLCESLNCGPVRWLTEWNFPGAAFPQVWRDFTQSEDLQDRSARDARIAQSLGFRPTLEEVERTYGGRWERCSTTRGNEEISSR